MGWWAFMIALNKPAYRDTLSSAAEGEVSTAKSTLGKHSARRGPASQPPLRPWCAVLWKIRAAQAHLKFIWWIYPPWTEWIDVHVGNSMSTHPHRWTKQGVLSTWLSALLVGKASWLKEHADALEALLCRKRNLPHLHLDGATVNDKLLRLLNTIFVFLPHRRLDF